MSDDNKSTTLVKHTAAIHISNILTLNQRKIANILLKNAYSDLKNGNWHSIQVRDLLNQLGWKNTSNSTEIIKNDLKVLNTVQLEWNIFNRDRKKTWNITTFLSDAKIESGTISYSYSLALRDALYNPNIYAKLDLLVQKLFKTKHAIVLWEYISCELSAAGKSKIYTKWMSLSELRKILGLQESKTYSSFNALNQKVLVPGIEEINKNSGISVVLETRKELRKVEWLRFIVEKPNVSDGKLEYASVKNIEFADDLGVSFEQTKRDVETYGEDRVRFALEYTKKQIDAGKVINNVIAFYKVALRENWSEQVSSSSIKKSQIDKSFIKNAESGNSMNFISVLRERVGDDVFSSWFLDMVFVSENEDEIIFKTSSAFKRDYIIEKFLDEIKSVVFSVSGNKGVSIIL